MTCGATLAEVAPASDAPKAAVKPGYDYRYGETDLYEGELKRGGDKLLFAGALMLLLVICGALALVMGSGLLATPFSDPSATASITPVPTQGGVAVATASAIILATNTSRPIPNLVTVTPAPPTDPPPPSPTLCSRIVQSGDTLLSIAINCGHRDLAVIDLIVEQNGLTSAEALQLGQEIIVPPPTPLGTETEPMTDATSDGTPDASAEIAQAESATPDPLVFPTETLQPGVAWHTVQPNETMLSIAVTYGASAEVLSQLNPEIPFLQCDFEFDSGGPRCTVLLGQGQRVRVPVPSATPTLSPTPNGSETPTPTATPTYNAPSALSPGDRSLFQRDQLITLRWVTTGTLGADQIYRVRVRDLTSGIIWVADTQELLFIVPIAWQGTESRRHEYEWSVSVIDLANNDAAIFTTQPRTFIWESRSGS
jgi:LysM repeat protein